MTEKHSRRSTRRLIARLILAAGVSVPFVVGISLAVLANVGAQSTASGGQPLPSAKQATLDKYAAQMAEGAAHPATRDRNWSPIPIPSDAVVDSLFPHRPAGAGILYEGAAQLPGTSGIVVRNVWIEQGANRILEVYAGGIASDPSVGEAVVAIWGPGRMSWLGGGTYGAPGHHGALAIVDATGEALSMRAADGSTITFDASTNTFR